VYISVTEIEQCCIFIRVFFYLLCIKHFYFFYKVRGCVVNLVGHGSCIMGHGSFFMWVSGSWVTVTCDPLFTLERITTLFGVNTPGGPWSIVLDGGRDPSTERVT